MKTLTDLAILWDAYLNSPSLLAQVIMTLPFVAFLLALVAMLVGKKFNK